jgi:glutamine cyclotransferase
MSISMRSVWKKLMAAGVDSQTRSYPIARRIRPNVSLLEDRFCPAASITGIKYDDLNGNGSRDVGEPGIAGAVIYVDLNRNGIRDTSPAAEPFAVTDSGGIYQISGLAPGEYVIREEGLPSNRRQTQPALQGGVDDPGVFLGTSYIPNTNQLTLVEIDAGTGLVTRIGGTQSPPMLGMVVTNSGQMIGMNGQTNALFSINRTTGQPTFIGNSGLALAWGLTYDPNTDTIYGLGSSPNNPNVISLVTFNRTNGAATSIGPGIPGLTGTSGLAFDAANNRILAFDNADKELYAFDATTGAGTRISTLPANVAGWGVAYDGQYLVIGVGNGILGYFDPNAGTLHHIKTPSEPVYLESLEYYNAEPNTYRVSLVDGETMGGVNFGSKLIFGSIQGTTYNDTNGNGQRDSGEVGTAGITVYADLNHNGAFDLSGVIDSDNYTLGTELNNAVPGVKLNLAAVGGTGPSPANKVRTGINTNVTNTPIYFRDNQYFWNTATKFRAEFDQTIGRVEIDFISSAAGQAGRLDAYNAQGQLIASFDTAMSQSIGQIQKMSINRAQGDIKFILAYTSVGDLGALDKLSYGFVEPSAVTDNNGNYSINGLLPGDYTVREVLPVGQHQTEPGPHQGTAGPGTFFGTAYIPNTNQLQLVEVDAGSGKVYRIGQIETVPMLGVVMTNDGKLYGIHGQSNTLFSINRTTGATTPIGPTGFLVTWGLTYDPDSDTIYILGQTDPGQNVNSLLAVNRHTGASMVVSNGIPGLTGTSGLAFDRVNKRVLAFDRNDKELYSFNVVTGQASLLLVLQQNVDSWGMAYDGQYLVMGWTNNNGQLVYINPNTGSIVKTMTPSEPLFLESFEYLTGEPLTRRVSVLESQTATGINFGNRSSLGSISGNKFEDVDGDGVRNPNEPGLANVPIYLDLNHNGTYDAGLTIDPDNYSSGTDLTNAVPGVTLNVSTTGIGPDPQYKVRAGNDPFGSATQLFLGESQAAWNANFKFRAEFTNPVSKVTIDILASGTAAPAVGRLEAYNAQGQLIATYDTPNLSGVNIPASLMITSAASDIKFVLAYSQLGQIRLERLRIGEIDAVAMTDSNGNYSFNNVPPGDYVVRETVPNGYRQTYPAQSGTQGVYFGAAYYAETGQTQLVEVDRNGKVFRIGGLMPLRMHGLIMNNQGQLFGISNFNQSNDGFYSINRSTGAINMIGLTGADLAWGLTYDPASDSIYTLGVVEGGVGLLKINPTTGIATRIGTGVVPNSGISGLAFDTVHNRVLVFDNETKMLMSVDPISGEVTHRATLPTSTFGWNLAFDGRYAVVGNNGPGTYFDLFDPITGQKMGQINLSEKAVFEGLEYIAAEPFAHRITVGLGQAVNNVNFGNKGVNIAPIANAGGPYTVLEGQSVTLDASASSDVEGTPLTYAWDLDNDGEYDDATGVSPTLTWGQLVAFGINDDGEYTIGLKVTDTNPEGSASATASTTLTVENAAPTVSVEVDQVAIAEAGAVTLNGTIADPGTGDSHHVAINWGDGSPVTVITLPAGQLTFSAQHTYVDDKPSNTAADIYTIHVNVNDGKGGTATDSTTVLVNNVAPVITSISNTATTIGAVAEGKPVSINVAFTDIGINDTHQATIDWGDGTIQTVSASSLNGTGSATTNHVYSVGGVYEIKVTLKDDDSSSVVATTRAFVTGASLRNGVLQIVGSTNADNVSLSTPSSNVRVTAAFLKGGSRNFAKSQVRSIQAFLGNGNDNFSTTGSFTIPLMVDGGEGNDNLAAAKGPSILIGGTGADILIGGTAEDILIAGTTAFDGNAIAWQGILTEWTDKSKSLTARIANLTNGNGTPTRANGNNFLTNATIQNDTSRDTLIGKEKPDWFFGSLTQDTISRQNEDYFGQQ